jgi:hypothetical protein
MTEGDFTLHRSDTGHWTLYDDFTGETVRVEGLLFVRGGQTRAARRLAEDAIEQRTGSRVDGWDEDHDGLGELTYHGYASPPAALPPGTASGGEGPVSSH